MLFGSRWSGLLIFTIFSVVTLYVIIGHLKKVFALTQEACDFYERRWINNAFPPSTRSEWVTLGDVKTHYLILPRKDPSQKGRAKIASPAMVLLHGTGSASSLAWSSSAGLFSKRYFLCMPDLPGFGRSTFPRNKLQEASLAEIEDFYADWLAAYIDAMQLQKPVVVAHSMGAFFAINFMKIYPDKLSRIVLVDPAGIFPTLGSHGYYFAWLFSVGIPTRQLRVVGWIASALLHFIYHDKKNAHVIKAHFWVQLQASPSAFGDRVVAKFITFNFNKEGTFSFWNRPAILDVLTAGVPVAFVYGAVDTVMPPRQGEVTAELMRCNSTKGTIVNLVPGAWHMPFHVDSGIPFVDQTLRAIDVACVPRPTRVLTDALHKMDAQRYRSTWSSQATAQVIESLYKKLDYYNGP